MTTKTRALLAAGVLLVLLAAVVVVAISRRGGGKTVTATAPAGPAAPAGPRVYQVGVIVSEYSASGPHWTDKPYGYSYQFVTEDLRYPNVRLIPLIEPGSESAAGIATALQTAFKGVPPRDVTNAAELSTLDVIVTSRSVNALPAALSAVESAVSSGVGLLHWCDFGTVTPGYGDPIVQRLRGLSPAAFGYNWGPVECEVVAEHPILGKLKPGQKLKLQPSGAYGVLNEGTPLVKVTDPGVISFHPVDGVAPPQTAEYFPIYVSALGKGRIVGCSFPAFREFPPSLNRAVGGRFLMRCVTWLAPDP